MTKRSEDLQVGDIMKFGYCENKVIKEFIEYKGVFDFVGRIAVFYDGTKMSLTKDHYYEIV